jgi:DNA-binding GntR family transcriptional regulator
VRDLLLVRRQLARVVLERLVETIDTAALASVGAAIDRFEAAIAARAGLAALARADLDVVAALVSATRSPVLQLCLNPVASVLVGLPRLQKAMYREPANNLFAFRAVLAWLESPSKRGLEVLLGELAARDEQTVTNLRRKGQR